VSVCECVSFYSDYNNHNAKNKTRQVSGYWPLAGEPNKLAEKGVLVDGMPQVPVIIFIISISIIIIIGWDAAGQGKVSTNKPQP